MKRPHIMLSAILLVAVATAGIAAGPMGPVLDESIHPEAVPHNTSSPAPGSVAGTRHLPASPSTGSENRDILRLKDPLQT
ncbi:MAG: hypothetical protein KDD44_11740, partial [Bdellovibrionales bacterium]|nr:hypothetical protein [Bdellovibrionales bacterium]